MTPLEFFIAVHNSEAMDGLKEMQGGLSKVEEQTEELYEGPGREMKIRTEIRGMIKDIAMGETPMNALINAAERLSEVFRWAGPVAAALAVGFALNEQTREAVNKATEFFDLANKIAATPIATSSIEQLKEVVKQMDDVDKKYGEAGFFQKLFFGSAMAGAKSMADEQGAAALDQIDKLTAAEIDAKTNALAKMSDEEKAKAGEIAQIRDQYREKIAQAQEKSALDEAEAWQRQMEAAINAVNDKYAEAAKKRQEEEQKRIEELKAQLAEVQDKTTKSTQERYNEVSAKLTNGADLSAEDRLKLQIEQAQLSSQLDKEADEAKAKQTEKDQAAQKTATEEEDKRAKLRADVLKAQFDALGKEDQLIVLRARQAALEKEIAADKKLGISDAELGPQHLELAKLQKQIAADSLRDNPLRGINADEALRGNMASGQWNRVTNDGADRAEKQRDVTNGYLRTLVSAMQRGGGDPFNS